jgi:hypothetical protein
VPFGATEGVSTGNINVAILTDTYPNAQASDYVATIFWGDGHVTSPATVTPTGFGGFYIRAGNLYGEEGRYTAVVSVVSIRNTSAWIAQKIVVSDANLTAMGVSLTETQGVSFSDVSVAQFSDANVNAPLGDFSAAIDWGDGNVGGGTIVAEGGGSFVVYGSYTYNQAGAFAITVTIKDVGGSFAIASGNATVSSAVPVVTEVGPGDGPTSGGTAVDISGTGLVGAVGVTFGSVAAQFSVNPDGSITAISPPESPGTVDIEVTTPLGTSSPNSADKFTYTSTGPTVTGLNPNSGPDGGGNSVEIDGTNLGDALAVWFGANKASFTVSSNSELMATAPPGVPNSYVDVTVQTPFGVSPIVPADQYYYQGVGPGPIGIGTVAGKSGTVVAVTGANLNGATGVLFGSVPATWFTIQSSGQLVAGAPSGVSGTVDVVVQTPWGNSPTGASDQFTFTSAPTVTSLSTGSGPPGGGNTVTLTGTGFGAATQVWFGTQAATSFTINSSTSITATAPSSLSAGVVDVTVGNAGGTSATGAADHYTYVATAPAVSGLAPARGPTAGATTVVITGTNFNGATAVAFGGSAAAWFNVDSPTQITAVSPAGSAGSADVRVTTSFGTSAVVSADRFSYADASAPMVTGVSPSSGPVAGGTSVTITGSGFTAATAVSFGGTAATSFVANSDMQITAVAPAEPAGFVDVVVTTPYGSSNTNPLFDGYNYLATQPAVTGVTGNTGTTAGGTTVTLAGSNFTGVTGVLFGSLPAASFTVNAYNSITAVSPVEATGVVDIKVLSPSGVSSTSASDQFTYTAATGLPTVTGVTASSGPTGGTNSVTVTGTNFTGATAVNFGSAAAVSFTVNSATSITAVVPAGVAGTVDVTVATSLGVSSTVAADHYAYTAATPTVSGLSVTSDFTTGSTTVTITGTNLNGATAVMFGSTAATSFTVNSSTSITAVDPAGSVGTVDVKVTTPYGTSAAVAADHFTYNAVPTPTVTGLDKVTGPLAGGDWVTVTGTGFTKATAVSFGGVAASNFTVVSDTQILAQAPAELSGTGDITVTDPTGTSGTVASDKFNFSVAAATVSGLSVSSGPLAGGTVVTVTGTNFVNVSQVLFGGAAGTNLTVNSPTQLTVTAPAQTTAGPVDIIVVEPNGVSQPVAVDQFTYNAAFFAVTGLGTTSGPTGGLTSVTINGAGFTGATAVNFGAVPAVMFLVNSDTSITALSPIEAAGVVDITVTTATGTTATVAADQFTYQTNASTPTVTGVSPGSGAQSGGTVTITGTNLSGTTAVLFGGVPAVSFTVNSATSITAQAPPGAAGTVDVTVATYGGVSAVVTADHYSYTASLPTVTAVSVSSGDTAGGVILTVTGTNFNDATQVAFGSVTTSTFTVLSNTKLQVTAPAAPSGTVDITVTNESGTSSTSSADHFTYTADAVLPTVTGLGTSSGPTGGTTSVTITGTNLASAYAVSFGGVAASSVVVNSATSITAIAPAQLAGTVDVMVTTPYGTSSAVTADHFTYVATAPSVSGVSPSSGPATGGYTVVISGSNFNGATAVKFGTTAATIVSVDSAQQITVTAPALSAGVWDVTVTTPYGTSATSSADHFTAQAAPTVTGVSPSSGPMAGGTSVVLTGTNFTGLVSVSFGGIPATAVTVNSATQITATAPASVPGTVDVMVTTQAGPSATSSADQFTYTAAAPVVTSVSLNYGPMAGGNSVTVYGSGFTGATGVSFGGVAGTSLTVVSDTQLTVTAPAQTAVGTVDLTVTTPYGGTSATTQADEYAYVSSAIQVVPGFGSTTLPPSDNGSSGAVALPFPITFTTNSYSSVYINTNGNVTFDAPLSTAVPFSLLTTIRSIIAPFFADVDARTGWAVTYGSGTAYGYQAFGVNWINSGYNSQHADRVNMFQLVLTNRSDVGAGAFDIHFNYSRVVWETGDSGGGSGGLGGSSAHVGYSDGSGNPGTSTELTGSGTPGAFLDSNLTTGLINTDNGGTTLGSYTLPIIPVHNQSGIRRPVVSGIKPASGPTAGGTSVTITGSGFTNVTDVLFGLAEATSFQVVSSTKIVAVSPAHSTGVVDVRVVTTTANSAATSADSFTYKAGGNAPMLAAPQQVGNGAGGTATIGPAGAAPVGSLSGGGPLPRASHLANHGDLQLTAVPSLPSTSFATAQIESQGMEAPNAATILAPPSWDTAVALGSRRTADTGHLQTWTGTEELARDAYFAQLMEGGASESSWGDVLFGVEGGVARLKARQRV